LEHLAMTDVGTTAPPAVRVNPDTGKRILLVLGLVLELVMMAAGLWPAAWLVLHYAPTARTPGHWVLIILAAVLVFNYGYLLALLLFRLIIPRPREGNYPINPDGNVPRAIRTFMLNALLAKARHDPPWAAMFSSVLTSVPPLGPLFRRFFGPRTTSATMGDTLILPDPHFVEAGKNVEFGYGCVIIAHHFDNRGMFIRKVTIGDNAVIGGESLLMAGVQVGDHAVIASRSMIYPNTKIGPYEYWAGAPAKKVKDLSRV
jgi:hypothetical protein